MHIEITTQGLELTQELDKYTQSKLGRIARLVARLSQHGSSTICAVRFTQTHTKETKVNTCTLKVTLGSETFTAEETTQHMYAALDIVTRQIEQQLKAYRKAQVKSGVIGHVRRTFRVL
jgi:ribosomal subunit interface protein